jgi:hemoglobin-like flavoprotein
MATPGLVSPETVQLAEESYRRCAKEAFFQAFYKRFVNSDPAIPPKFANTDFDRQNKLLQHGIGLLFVYARRRNPVILDRISDRHGPADLNIEPRFYPLFADALVATVAEFDPQYTPEIGQAWREAMEPGIRFMTARFGRASGEGAEA